MRLIDNWRVAGKFLSVQANAIGASLATGYLTLYDKLKENFPPKYMFTITVAVFVLGIIGRLIQQDDKS
jgi:hypothetical protein